MLKKNLFGPAPLIFYSLHVQVPLLFYPNFEVSMKFNQNECPSERKTNVQYRTRPAFIAILAICYK